MRESRAAINQFWPKTYDDFLALTKGEHPETRPIDSGFVLGDGLRLPHGVQPDSGSRATARTPPLRQGGPPISSGCGPRSPTAFRNAEWVSRESAEGRRIFGSTARVQKMLASR
jgi:hypothetical protein